MNLDKILNMPVGTEFKYNGAAAKVVWVDHVKYLIVKGNKNSEDVKDKVDVYFKSSAIFFICEGRPEGITLSSSFPKPELLAYPEFSM